MPPSEKVSKKSYKVTTINVYAVYSYVQEYDVPGDASWYDSIPDPHSKRGITVLDHIINGSDGTGHGWAKELGTSDPQVPVSLAGPIARCTNMDVVIECSEKHFVIKYDLRVGVVVFIVDNEFNPPAKRLNSTYPMDQSKVANKIIKGRWDLS